jgi:vacuolar-type H+-ATPase subunit H
VLEKKENVHSAAVATFLSSQEETVAKASSQAKVIIADAEKKARS